MGYALFAQSKITYTGQLNSVNLQQTQRSNEQYALATQTLSLQQQMSSIQSAQATQLANQYQSLAAATSETQRNRINATIKQLENQFQSELDKINNSIYLVSVKENAIEMEVKRLDTRISAIQKQLEAIQDAEGDAIDRATPKFSGNG